MMFHLGTVLIEAPGPFNATDTTEDFGHDYAVKPVVGAMQDREAMGPADNHMTITGTLFPDFYKRLGQDTGLTSIDRLREMADKGSPQPLVRGDGRNLGYWLIEKVSVKSSKLSQSGVGKVITYDIQLVRTNREPAKEDSAEMTAVVMNSLISLYG